MKKKLNPIIPSADGLTAIGPVLLTGEVVPAKNGRYSQQGEVEHPVHGRLAVAIFCSAEQKALTTGKRGDIIDDCRIRVNEWQGESSLEAIARCAIPRRNSVAAGFKL